MATFSEIISRVQAKYVDTNADFVSSTNIGIYANEIMQELATDYKCCHGRIAMTAGLSDIQKFDFTGKSGDFTIGETVTDSGSGSGTVQEYYEDGNYLLVYVSKAFTEDLTITGGTSGATATLDEIYPSGLHIGCL